MRTPFRRSRQTGFLPRVADFATRRPRLVAGIWIVVVLALASVGRNLEHELGVHLVFADGKASKRAHDIAVREFGNDYAMIVMLRGPRAQVESQGRLLGAKLESTPGTLVLAPWTGGGNLDGLSPSPNVVTLVVRIPASNSEGVSGVLPTIRKAVDEEIADPVRVSLAGFPVVIESIRSATEKAGKTGELIAGPLLLLILLLVFRSAVAALLPVVIGGAVVAATRGLFSILHHFVQLDLFAIGVVGMMGLALGVDYSLLVVSRYREERRARGDADPRDAIRATAVATARSVVPAGCGLIFAMTVAAVILQSTITSSVAIAVILATLLSVTSALCVVPALLMMLGDNLDRWALPIRRPGQAAPLRWARRATNRPAAVFAIIFILVLLSGWAFTLNSGVASIAFLPSADPGRQQQEQVEDTLGPGWTAPMEVIVNGRGQPITSAKRLRALASFQRRVEHDPGIQTMAGFSAIARGAERADGVEAELAKQERGLKRLASGIGKAHEGAVLTTTRLRQAATGSKQIQTGLGAARGGAGALAGALQKVGTGSERLSDGIDQVGRGSGKVAQGTTKASDGAGRLAEALDNAREQSGELSNSATLLENAMNSGNRRLDEVRPPLQVAEERLTAAWQALQRMSAGRSDPEYAAVQSAVEEASLRLSGKDVRTGEIVDPSYEGVDAGVERAEGQFDVGRYLSSQLDKQGKRSSEGIEKLANASDKLERGLGRLADGSEKLSRGAEALGRGGEALPGALSRLGTGAEHLSGGLGLLEDGAHQLSDGLGQGAQKSTLLSGGLRRIGAGLAKQGDESKLAELEQRSPGLFRSAYFVLAGLDGSRPGQRRQLDALINLNRDGTAGRLLIVPRDPPTSDAARKTKDRVEGDAADLAHKTGAEVLVGGIGPTEMDVNEMTRDRAPLVRLALALVTLIVLIPVLRSVIVPLLATLINLLTVTAALGVLALLFNGSLLGGPGYIDATVILATIIVMFGLAIDYEVFVFARIREEYVRTGSTRAAVAGGLDRTAHVVTGAAGIMITVFLSFSISELMTLRNFGIAQAVAVAIDAFVVRLIVVPAIMNRLGGWCWWMPRWLDRLLPSARSPADLERG